MRNFTQACQSDCQSCNPPCTQCSKVLFLVQTTETQRFSSKKNRRNQWRYLDQVILFKNRSDVKLNYLSNAGFSICVKTQMRQIYEVRPSISPRKQNITEIFLLVKFPYCPILIPHRWKRKFYNNSTESTTKFVFLLKGQIQKTHFQNKTSL